MTMTIFLMTIECHRGGDTRTIRLAAPTLADALHQRRVCWPGWQAREVLIG